MPNAFVKCAVSLCSAAALLTAPISSLSEGYVYADSANPQVFINEICTGNNGENGNLTDAVDKNNEYCDWIELYNAGSQSVNISGWQLVKDGSSVYTFGDITLSAGSYTVVYCSKNYKGDKSQPYASYNLSGDGVNLSLTDGTDEIDSVECPALEKDTVWARKPDGSDSFSVLFPTPRGSNNSAESAVPCNAPELSAQSGMYSQSFNLEMSTDKGNTIYYTTDGTDPQTSSTRIEYTSPINIYDRSSDKSTVAKRVAVSKITPWNNGASLPSESAVDKGTVIRACTYSAAGEYSDTVTKTYFVGVSNADHNNLPIMSVTTDPDNLFDYEKGIYVTGKVYDDNINTAGIDTGNPPANYNQKGKDWERECHIDFFESDGTLALSQDCGMRTQGAYSRADYQKSFRFYARSEYGEKNFKYPFFASVSDNPEEAQTKFKKIVLRNGGNDAFYTKFKDSYIQSLVADRDMETQTGRPCVLFIDGEYWGIYTLQEDYSDSYFEENYGVDSDEVIVYKKGEIDEGEESDIAYFTDMKTYAKTHDLSKSEYYNKMSEMLDIDSFIDYMATEIYINNEDWPGNNYAMWRVRNTDDSNPYADGKWRCLLYDTEMGVDHYGNSSTKYNVDNLKKVMSNSWDDLTVLFNALIKNAEFKQKFVTAFMDITNVNFKYETTVERKQFYMDTYYPELTKFFKRFPTWANVSNATDPCLSRMDTFLKKRPTYVTTMLQNNLGLGTAVTVNVSAVNPEGGTVKLNTSTLDLTEAFSGSYFTDYDITLTAQAKDGYSFAGWAGSVTSNETTITVSPEQASNVQAVFVPDGGDSTLCKVTFKSDSKTVVMYAVKGAAATIPEESFAREGYTVEFTPNPTNITGDTVCTAVYTGIGYKIKYMPNGGSGKAYTQSMVYGTNAKLMDCDFTKSGYEFAGWATKSGATEADYTAGQSVGNLTSTEGKTVYLYAVWKKSVAKCTFSGISSSYVYSGSAVRPTVTVKDGSKTLTKGTDYTVTYSGGTSCGTAKITVTGKGSYTGKRTLSFAVVPDKTTVGRVSRSGTAIRLVWTAVKGADSYEIQKLVNGAYVTVGTTTDTQYRDSGMKNGTQAQYRIRATGGGQYGAFTYITTCTKTRTPSLKATAKVGKVKLSWNRISEADGYQVLMSTSKNGKYTAIRYPNPASVTSCTRTGLTSGKTYYFKIRSYKTVNGKKLWSDCSAAVKVTVK